LSEEYKTTVWALQQVANWKGGTPEEIITASEKVRQVLSQFLNFEGQIRVSLLRNKGALRKGWRGIEQAIRQIEEIEEQCKSAKEMMVKERAEGMQLVAESLSKLGQTDKALVFIERSINLDPSNPKSYMLAGKLYFRKGDVQKVVQSYEGALDKGLSFPHLVNELEKMRDLLTLTKLESGKKFIGRDSRSLARLLTINGNILAMQGLLDQATNRYQQALLVCPEYLQANIKLGHIYRQFGNLILAREQFDLALSASVRYIRALAYDGLGAVERQEKNYSSAIALYQQSLELSPSYSNAFNGLGKTYCLQGDYSSAIKAFESALSIKDDAYWVVNNLAIAQLLIGEKSSAKDNFKKAAELSKKSFYSASYLSYMNVGIALIGEGELDEGVLAIRQALSRCKAQGLLQELISDLELIAHEIQIQRIIDELRALI